jgi:ankyrin repeat protein
MYFKKKEKILLIFKTVKKPFTNTAIRTKNNSKVLKLLLDNGADINFQDNSGDTVSRACEYGFPHIVKLLLSYGADVIKIDSDKLPLQ